VPLALRFLPRILIKTKNLVEQKCFNCHYRLCDTAVEKGVVEIKCKKCGQVNYIVGTETEKQHA
jgi:phage FluMu protein Com